VTWAWRRPARRWPLWTARAAAAAGLAIDAYVHRDLAPVGAVITGLALRASRPRQRPGLTAGHDIQEEYHDDEPVHPRRPAP
jgi:hypothetical protein